MHTITVYSQPNCQPCRATKKKLDSLGLDYEEVDVTTSPGTAEYLASAGYHSTPVVLVEDAVTGEPVATWAGYSPDKIKALAGAAKASEVAGV